VINASCRPKHPPVAHPKALWALLVNCLTVFFSSLLEWAAEIHWLGKALKSAAGLARDSLEEFTMVDREDIEKVLAETLENSRLIVLIDDVDRTEGNLLPYLLLSLREVLDLPGCAFVLALDPEVVAKELGSLHAGWGSGVEFLEKIINFPRWLPKPTSVELDKLIQAELPRLREFVDEAALRDISDLLSTNPRRLKQFLHQLWLLRQLAARHDPDEISWTSLLICELLQ
jgi:KAP family P-loop domain